MLFKRNGLRFWNIYLDKFGTPTAIGKYPRGSSKQDINNLLASLQAMATDSGIIVPEGVAVDLLSAARSGVADFATLYDKMDAAITKIVLSQTMTTDNGSSRSQADVHNDVKLEVVKSDADLQSDSFNKGPARWWTDYNYGADVAAPILSRVVEQEEDAKANAETDKVHAENGWVRTEKSFAETYGEGYVRKDSPDAPSGFGQASESGQQQPMNTAATGDNRGAQIPSRSTSFSSAPTHSAGDSIDQNVDLMIEQDGFTVAQAMTGDLIAQLTAAMSEEEVRRILDEALVSMDDAPLAQALERASFAIRADAETQPASNGEKS